MMFMKLIVVHYVKNFHFKTSLRYEDVRVKAGITLKLIGDYLVEIKKRENVIEERWEELDIFD